VRQLAPHAYQLTDGQRHVVSSRYVLSGGRVTISLGAYDHHRALVIDPTVTLAYSTYLGGTGLDDGNGIAVDAAGSAYVTGATGSMDFPVTPGAFQTKYPGGFSTAFVSKLTLAGTALVYSTYLGGTRRQGVFFSGDSGNGIAVDSGGSAYVTGRTSTFDFPTTPGAFQATEPNIENSANAFVSKLNQDGTGLFCSTYLGQYPCQPKQGACRFQGDAVGNGIVVDSLGSAYVTGRVAQFGAATGGATTAIFPTTPGAFRTSFYDCGSEAFVTKFNPSGSGLEYSTLLGGSTGQGNVGAAQEGEAIALGSAGSAFVTGQTSATDFPTTPGVVQSTNAGGDDAFVTRLNATGTGLLYSTYLGGKGTDRGHGIAVDSADNAYVTGETTSADFPTSAGAYLTSNASGQDAFVTKLSADAKTLVYSTYLGGLGDDSGSGIAVDSAGSAFVTGRTASMNFPHTTDAYQPTYAGGQDAFVTKLMADGSGLLYSTFLGGTGADGGNGIALDSAANPYITGITGSMDFPTANPEQPANHGNDDAFVAKFGPAPASTFGLSVHTAGAGGAAAQASGTVVSDSGGISCARTGGTDDRGTCSRSFTSGTVVRLTATPDAQSTAGLSGDCPVSAGAVGQPVSCSVTVDQTRSVTATFTRQTGGGGAARSTSTSVSCASNPDTVGAATACTVTVAGTSGVGQGTYCRTRGRRRAAAPMRSALRWRSPIGRPPGASPCSATAPAAAISRPRRRRRSGAVTRISPAGSIRSRPRRRLSTCRRQPRRSMQGR